jgi:hypothetical protein
VYHHRQDGKMIGMHKSDKKGQITSVIGRKRSEKGCQMDSEKTGMKSGVKTACEAGWQDENRCDGMVVFIIVM